METSQNINVNSSSDSFLQTMKSLSKIDENIKALFPSIEDELVYISENFEISTVGDIINVLEDDVSSWDGDEEIFASDILEAIKPYIK